ncbi:MAG: cytochrome C oxidase subunit IV family protein [Pseudomonadota bacterium]|uniref:Cytochrome C oxidase subunit IV n=1 Tax=marine metagenome TaxID=408172 RepID=A0A381PL72_9ZZZZ|nr:cytochrome C oxidase subunit IV family protein [Pseudomonadota bacterium]MEC8868676.1 cytochrome C oxidase subunit IV family protein [Pseudomonadota bacterium]HBP13825.1 cytochrome C oxidase subunit IV [Gammaproteobacteria bacterium]HCP50680.1 cytochrome C oxidase subunit IV [Gammaproteobacteria bacterium]|tara:strand:- start:8241 stop:8615 length:375 start_codon:yes stop_codon:yes gene_type:complete
MTKETGQRHPIRIYLVVWGLLFLVSALSYSTDFLDRGFWRWTLILLFMVLKAGFIVAVFMHMRWERLALMSVVLVPPVLLMVLVGLMTIESDYTRSMRIEHFETAIPGEAMPVVEREIRNRRPD